MLFRQDMLTKQAIYLLYWWFAHCFEIFFEVKCCHIDFKNVIKATHFSEKKIDWVNFTMKDLEQGLKEGEWLQWECYQLLEVFLRWNEAFCSTEHCFMCIYKRLLQPILHETGQDSLCVMFCRCHKKQKCTPNLLWKLSKWCISIILLYIVSFPQILLLGNIGMESSV